MNEGVNSLRNWRMVLFRLSCVAALLSAGAMVVDWTAPFPLIHLADGSYSISPWDAIIFEAGLSFCALTILLAAFGRAIWRWMLIVLGVSLLVLSAFGFLGSHR
jgi:hypothetical protein